MLCHIDENYQPYALHIQQWLAFSLRPLRLKEYPEVIAIGVNDNHRFEPQRWLPDPQDVLETCSSLITVTHWSSEVPESQRTLPESLVLLAHFSVKEYLLSETIRQGQAAKYSLQEIECHASLAKDCLAHLLRFREVGSLTSEVLAEYPLALYVAKVWTTHARVAGKRDKTICQDVFLTKGEVFNYWIQLSDQGPPFNSITDTELERLPKGPTSPLYYPSVVGVFKSVRTLIDKWADINARGFSNGRALQAASSSGILT